MSARAISALCGISVQAVYKWEKSGRIPAEYCRAIEEASHGVVTRYELRPDVFGAAQQKEAA